MQERVTMRENRPWDRGLGVLLDEQASKYNREDVYLFEAV